MMDEVRFVHVWRRSRFLAFILGVPASDFVDAALPLTADHPRWLVAGLGVDRVRDPARYTGLPARGDDPKVDVEVTELPFFLDILSGLDPAKGQDLFVEAALREDSTEHDLKLFIPHERGRQAAKRRFCEISPIHRWLGRSASRRAWADVEGQARWEADGWPTVLVALGRQYIELKRWEDAQRCLKRGLTLSPDKVTYKILRMCCRGRRPDWKGWQDTLDQFLNREEDYGLDRAGAGGDRQSLDGRKNAGGAGACATGRR